MKPRITATPFMMTANTLLVVLTALASVGVAEGSVHAAAEAKASMRGPPRRKAHQKEEMAPLLTDDADVPPRVLQKEVEIMVSRANKLAPKAAAEFDVELEGVEVALAKRAAADSELSAEIRQVRANLCARQGFLSHQAEDCDSFMRRSCARGQAAAKEEAPAAEVAADDDADSEDAQAAFVQLRSEPATSQVSFALCEQYFHEEQVEKGDEDEEEKKEKKEKKGDDKEEKDDKEDEDGDDKEEEEEKEKGWFQKKEGPLPENGYSGKKVEHNDLETLTSDWQSEFGPSAGHRSFKDICADFKDNEWCRLHGYYDKPKPTRKPKYEFSGASTLGGRVVVSAAVAVALAQLA